jgi:RNA polymerase sigma-70 factor (ECF subfamily)
MQTYNITDKALVEDYISGNEKSLEVLILRHKQKIYGFIFSKVKNRDITEDLFQDTFVRVIKTLKQGKYNEEGKFLPWVMRISHNLVIDHFRKTKRMPKFNRTDSFDIFDVISDGSLDVESKMIREQIHGKVKSLIHDLPEDQKEVLIHRIYNELSFKEIAEKTNVSINTVLGRMRYALINLRKIIATREIILTN